MRFGKGIATFTLAASMLAGGATAATAATPAAPQGGGLVNVVAKNILNGNQVTVLQNVAVPVAAAVCGLNVNVLSKQLQHGKAKCPALSNVDQLAWVVPVH